MEKYTKEQILDALKNVRYPGTGKDVIEMGFLSNDIKIDGNKVSFSMMFEKPNDPFMKSVVKACETAILTYVSKDINIKGNIEVYSKPIEPAKVAKVLPKVKNIIAVTSGKGGVGKSTIASNLAIGLAQKGYKVGLLDADVFGPSMPKMFHEEDAQPFVEEIDGQERLMPIEKYGVKLLSIGFFVRPNEAIVWRGTLAGNALKQLITDAEWGELDYFIIDFPPGTSDIHLTLIQTLGITGAIVVTTPQDVAVADARKGIDMFTNEKVGVPILGIVENMSWFTPVELPENKYYLFGKNGGLHLAEKMKVKLLGQIPIVQSVCEGGDDGMPAILNKDSLIGLAFSELANEVIKAVDKRNEEFAPTKKVEITKK